MTFSVIVSVNKSAFDMAMRRQYIVDVARGLSVDPAAVSITSVREFSVNSVSEARAIHTRRSITSRPPTRRTHERHIEVATSVESAPDTVLSLKQAIARNEFTMTIHGVVVTLTVLGDHASVDVTNTSSSTTTPTGEPTGFWVEGQLMQLAVYVTVATVFTAGVLLIVWRLCTQSDHGTVDDTQGLDPEAAGSDVIPAAAASHVVPVTEPTELSAAPRDTQRSAAPRALDLGWA